MSAPTPSSSPTPLRSVAIPREHGGWGLTLEPALLGLALAFSTAGVLLGVAALVAFIARTPLRVLLVDWGRRRWLPRSRIALGVLGVESVVLAGLVAGAALSAAEPFWLYVLMAVPLVAVELWFDMRSKSRRLLPELAGAVGIASVAAMIVAAGGGGTAVAIGAWCVLAGRAVTSIPYVRMQVAALHGRATQRGTLAATDACALLVAAVAPVADLRLLGGLLAVAVVVGLQRLEGRRVVAAAKVLGIRQMALGLFVVAATALWFVACPA